MNNYLPLITLACASTLAAQVSFTPTNYAVNSQPDGVAFGDVDLDGDLDFVVAADNPVNGVQIWTNDGAGNFALANTVFVGSQTRTVALEDLDGDGDLDLAVGTGFGQVTVLANLGFGNFGAGTSFPVGANPRGISVADFNGDLRRDLVVANRDGNSVSVLLNNGNLSFTSTTVSVGLEPRKVIAADFNRDGADDLAVANHDSRDVSVRLNNGNGTFGPDVRLQVGAQFRGEWVTAADTDGDGDLEILVALGETVGRLGVFQNAGNGTFGPIQITLVNGTEPGTVIAMDVNGDRIPDAITANEDSNNASVLLGNGAGGFAFATNVATGANPEGFDGGDIDGDGDIDLITSNRDSNSVTVLRNTSNGAATTGTVTVPGTVNLGTTTPILLSSPPDASMFYLLGLSTAAGQTQLPDGRLLPVGFSDALLVTLANNAIIPDAFGMLDGSGHGFPRLVWPSLPALTGLTLHGMFFVLDGGQPLDIGTISDSATFQLQ